MASRPEGSLEVDHHVDPTIDHHTILPLTFGLLAAGVIVSFVGYSSNNLMPALISVYIEHFSLSESAAGFFGSLESIFIAVGTFILASKLDLLPTTRLLLAGVALTLVGQICAFYSGTDTTLLFISRPLAGFGLGILLAVINAIGAQTENPDRFYAITWAFTALLDSFSFLVLPFFLGSFGSLGVFVLLACCLGLVLFVVRAVPQVSKVSEAEYKQATGNSSLGNILLVMMFLLFVGLGSIWAFSDQIMSQKFLMDESARGVVLSTAVIIGFLGSTVAAMISSKTDRTICIYFGVIILTVTSCLCANTSDKVIFIGAFITFIMMIYFSVPFLLGLFAALDPDGELSAKASGTLILGTAFGPMVGGKLVELYGYSALAVIFLVVCVFSIASVKYVTGKMKEQATGYTISRK